MKIMSQGLNYLGCVIYYNKECICHADLALQTRLPTVDCLLSNSSDSEDHTYIAPCGNQLSVDLYRLPANTLLPGTGVWRLAGGIPNFLLGFARITRSGLTEVGCRGTCVTCPPCAPRGYATAHHRCIT
jgi:hypothetical protein